jgi:hypothetical protein
MDSDRDDLDGLVLATQPHTPEQLAASLRGRTRMERRAGVLIASVAGLVLCFGVLVTAAIMIGSHAQEQGAVALLTYAAGDVALLHSDLPWFVTTLVGTVFWPGVVSLALGLLVITRLFGVLIHAADGEERPVGRR